MTQAARMTPTHSVHDNPATVEHVSLATILLHVCAAGRLRARRAHRGVSAQRLRFDTATRVDDIWSMVCKLYRSLTEGLYRFINYHQLPLLIVTFQ